MRRDWRSWCTTQVFRQSVTTESSLFKSYRSTSTLSCYLYGEGRPTRRKGWSWDAIALLLGRSPMLELEKRLIELYYRSSFGRPSCETVSRRRTEHGTDLFPTRMNVCSHLYFTISQFHTSITLREFPDAKSPAGAGKEGIPCCGFGQVLSRPLHFEEEVQLCALIFLVLSASCSQLRSTDQPIFHACFSPSGDRFSASFRCPGSPLPWCTHVYQKGISKGCSLKSLERGPRRRPVHRQPYKARLLSSSYR